MSEALDYWRDKIWCAADAVGIKLTDEQLESITTDITLASVYAPPYTPKVDRLSMRTEG